jgi:DNA end-binding protein Ku
MARPIWKGAITFGLVTIPVGLYSAIERKAELSFRLLHDKDESPIDYRRLCQEENVEVPWSEIVRGYEYQKGHFVVLTDEDFAKARVPGTDSFEIRDFVPAAEIDPVYFDQPYYVTPAGKAGVKAYALLRDALRQTGRVGVGSIVLRQREHLGGLHPVGDALVLSMLRYAHELRGTEGLGLPRDGDAYAKREMALGRELVESLAGSWDPTQYRDLYREALLAVIEKKIRGEEIAVPEAKKAPARVVNLARALEASLRAPARREGAKAPARRRAAKTARRKRAA